LLNKQLEYLDKVNKHLDLMSNRKDIKSNTEMYDEIKRAIKINKDKRNKLVEEGKPSVDYEYPRLL
jgi:hypothetical protein